MQSRCARTFVVSCVVCVAATFSIATWSQSRIASSLGIPWLTDDPVPNFSGGWVSVEGNRTIEIDQNENQFIAPGPRGGMHVFALDGSESRNEIATASGDVWRTVSHARWVEGSIVIETTYITPNGSFDELIMYFRALDGRLNVSALGADIRSPQIMGIQTTEYEKQS